MELQSRFSEVITSEAQFRAVTGSPSELVTKKELSAIDAHARAFIAKSPFILVGTCGADGRMDLSLKGDPPGFVQVLDETTLAIPDRLGDALVRRHHAHRDARLPGSQSTGRNAARR